MGGACCAKTDPMPEDYILNIYSTLRIKNYSFQILYQKIMMKEFCIEDLPNLSKKTINFIDFKKVTEHLFYNISCTDEIHYNMHKQIFEQILRLYTSPKGEISVIGVMTLFLCLFKNSIAEKTNFFYEMHKQAFNSSENFKNVLLNYLKDTIYFLSNIIVEHHEYETPDSLFYFLSSFTQMKVEAYFSKSLHKDLNELTGECPHFKTILEEVNFIFDFGLLRQHYIFHYKEDRMGDFTADYIKSDLDLYYQNRKKIL